MRPPKLSFMAMLPPEVRERLRHVALACGWMEQAEGMFDARHWHQSLSSPMDLRSGLVERMLAAGRHIEAERVSLLFNRIAGPPSGADKTHWAFRTQGRPHAFDALVTSVRTALLHQGLEDPSGHAPHITISYRAPHAIATQWIAPIAWRIDEVSLVQGGGEPFHYETLARWPLRPTPQLELW